MSDTENRKNHRKLDQEEIFADGCFTYVGATIARNARLQNAREQFQDQVDWLNGYLFIVNEQLSIEPRIPARVALSYLESLKDVIRDLRSGLDDVERLSGRLEEALAREVESEPEAQASPDPYALLRGWRACMAGTRPSDWEQIVSHLLEDTDVALANAEATAQKTQAREPERSTEPSGGA